MTAVTLNPATGLSPAAASVNGSGSTKEKSNDFGDLMLGKLSNRGENAVKQTEVTFKDGTKTKISTPVRKDNDFSKSNRIEEKKLGSGDSKKTDENINAQEAAAALGVMNNIIQGVSDILNISEEELATALDALGMKPEDLLNQNSLAELVLQQNGSQDMADMLVDNGMLETFNELRDFVNETLSEEGLDADSFAKILTSDDFKVQASELAKSQDTGKLLDDYYSTDTEANSVQEIRTINTEMESSGAENEAGLASDSTDTDRTDRNDDVIRVDVNPEAFINNLENAAGIDEMAELQQAQFREIAFQVVEQVRVNLTPDTTSMEMQLNPENLGRVAINISSKAGIMTAEITTENQQAKEAIESQLQILKENIEAKGVRVEAIEVKVSDFSFADSRNAESNADQYNGGQEERHPRRGNFSMGDSTEDEESDAVRIAREILQNSGSTVNYRA